MRDSSLGADVLDDGEEETCGWMSAAWNRGSEALGDCFHGKAEPWNLDHARQQLRRRRSVEGEEEPCGCTSAAWKRGSETLGDCFHGKA